MISADLGKFLGPAGALLSSLTWAYGSSIYAREARRVGAIEVNLTRAAVTLPLFLCSVLLLGQGRLLAEIGAERLLWLGASTLCSYGVGDTLFYLAATRLAMPTALAIGSTFPIWAMAAGVLALHEPLTAGRVGGTLLCVAGVAALVLRERRGADGERGRPATLGTGVLLALLTSALWAGNTYTIRRGAAGLPLFCVNAVRYGMVIVLLAPALALSRRRQHPRPPLLLGSPRMPGFAAACVIEAFLGSSFFVYGLSHTDLGVAAPLTSLAPLFAVPIGLLLRTERLDLFRLGAVTITVAGVVLLLR